MSANLERLSGLEEEQKRHLHMSKEDPAHVRALAEDHAATLEQQREDESTRQAVEVRAWVRGCVGTTNVGCVGRASQGAFEPHFMYCRLAGTHVPASFLGVLQPVCQRSMLYRDSCFV